MFFAVNYDNGYVVTLTRVWDDGRISTKPLRKFEHQGHAFIFRDHDCPYLTETEIKMLVKRYDPNIKVIRVHGRKFEKAKEQ